MDTNSKLQPTGEVLLQRYVDALTNLITMERAKIIADSSEKQVLNSLDNLGARNGVYITPDDIPGDVGNQLVKDSLNSHLMKVQSEQIAEATKGVVAQSELDTKKQFIGKKVNIEKIGSDNKIFQAVMFDTHTGQYRTSPYTVKRVKGTIYDISFEHNVLVIKPTFLARKLSPNRLLVDVAVLDINSMSPNIKIII